ncbi:tryptophan-rich sensory protein [Aquimarina celericrescens]|uniref:Tryptophan-rich sensory protein n=1 Tax=Aquimarina celericrescens TaxID=1964542 RepID=A0ABW5B0E6_9FLAO|nr:tryptophan-rich sensory protein [Aquimarina celericrescens]
MSAPGNKIVTRFKRHWQLKLWIEVIMYALGLTIFTYFVFQIILFSVVVFVVAAGIMALIIKPYALNLQKVSTYIDQHLHDAEYSTGLLLIPEENLSDIAKLQQHKIITELNARLKTLKPPGHSIRGVVVMGLFVVIGFVISQFDLMRPSQKIQQSNMPSEQIVFVPTDSTQVKTKPPKVESQHVTIQYPKYTNTPSFQTSEMNIKVLEGSELSWHIKFDSAIESVTMESMGNHYPMQPVDSAYVSTSKAKSTGFYNFKFINSDGASYVSQLYSIEVIKDQIPIVEVKDIKQFTSFSFKDSKNLAFNASITDDFGVASAYIIATVSKGSGESVKFREEKLNFDTGVVVGGKRQNLSKTINLDQMKMEPGDELYFYIEVLDQKRPKPNKSRSETFFAVVKDTVSDQFAVEGTMGVDLMPDYFRSQRQLIIDTEKLLKDKPKLLSQEFKFKSNELGFDQKVLRIKYAEFMGDESEFGPAQQESEGTHEEGEQHDSEDPLAEYTHKHDTENEHNLVAEEGEGGEKEDPLHEYLHNHDDPEESTLFTQSLKSKLRQALNQMWDSELYLRLYQPEKSLTYQYKALKLIQEIKNSARIYVHRIGFDPPPIKENKRLTGKIKKVKNFRKEEELAQPALYPFIRQATLRLEQLVANKQILSESDRNLFEQARNELAIKAIEAPGKYLKTLQQLKQITEIKEIPSSTLIEVQKELFAVLPEANPNPIKKEKVASEINELLLKELEIHD